MGNGCPNDGGVGAGLNHCLGGYSPKTFERCQIRQRFNKIGFALPVVANDRSDSICQRDLRRRIVTKVGELQVLNNHSWATLRRY